MSSKFRNVALLLPAFVLATGLASAQPGVKVSQVNTDGSVTTTSIKADTTSGGPGAKSPVFSNPATPGLPYWDVQSLAGTSTNYYNQVPYLVAPPNPSIAAGPDDIILVVNRTISRYPNPNAFGLVGTTGNPINTNPYFYLATEMVPLDVWMGLNLLGGNNSAAALCPSGTGSNQTCVIDNASIRYDQMIGRFVVLFTVTDMPAHRSNWVLVTSTFAQFQNCVNTPANCPSGSGNSSSPFFTTPKIAQTVGGTGTGGVNGGATGNWTMVTIPINLTYNPQQQPSALGLINNSLANPPFNTAYANSAVGTLSTVATGGNAGVPFLTVPFCTNGGPALPLTYTTVAAPNIPTSLGAGGTGRQCTNYFPTNARMGIDNDNIILTAAVLDQAFSPNEGNFPAVGTPGQGPYAGTRVTTIPKTSVYYGNPPALAQPPGCLPNNCGAVNLADNAATGTLSAINTQIAFGKGLAAAPPAPAGDLQYNAGGVTLPGVNPATPNTCFTTVPTAIPTGGIPAAGLPLAFGPAPALSCAPLGFPAGAPQLLNALPPTFWEPDNLRGRALASFDAQVAVFGLGNLASQFSGVITPIDYLVGTQITDNFGLGVVPTGVSGVTGQPNTVITTTITPPTAGIGTKYYLQPIVFSCPSGVLLLESVSFCGFGVNNSQSLVADLPLFGGLIKNMGTLVQLADPSPVGQGFSAAQMTTSPANVPVTPTTNSRIFVGDSRPEQVMFREGLLYVARSIRLGDLSTPINWLGTSTVLYDIIKTCATGATLPSCGGYSVNGANLLNPALAFEYEWFNGLSVPDPNGDINGFGFYQPMFEVPADVISTGPVSPISTLQLFDKLFVGMTTGGTNNTAGIFSKDYPSLWDFRPGDDAFDTIEPYLDPYTGTVKSTYQCGGDVTVNVLSKAGSTITVADPTGLGAGMFLTGSQTSIVSIAGNVVTLSAAFGPTPPVGATFTRIQPTVTALATLVTAGSPQITVSSAAGLLIGQTISSAATNTTAFTSPAGAAGDYTNLPAPVNPFAIASATNVGVGMAVSGKTNTVSTVITQNSAQFTVPNSTQIAVGEKVSGTGIPALTTIMSLVLNPDNSPTIVVTMSANATASSITTTTVTLDDTGCFSGTITTVTNTPTVTSTASPTCASFVALAALHAQLLGVNINNGIPVTFTSTGFGGGSIILISGNVITMSANLTIPGGAATTNNIPFTFTTAGTAAVVTCPIIPFSARGGASTDPNDGSLWLFGEFAKNRLSTIPGPGQWGTSVANYALSFPAVDAYGNDNTAFQDVQPPTPVTAASSAFFTWIQLAKNVGIATPSATGPCTINNGNAPIQQPPVSGTTPNPSPTALICPYFGPTAIVTRAEMSYWVVKSQMDEQQVSNFLCATGGDPAGIGPCGGAGAVSTYADVGPNGGLIKDPFLPPFTVATIPGAQSVGYPGVTQQQLLRYIEVMGRRGYSKGCSQTFDLQTNFCPNDPVTRAQMAAFIIRAKMSNVFPITLSGALSTVIAAPYGDAFGVFPTAGQYFQDEPPSDPFYPYIQKLRELRITNGSGTTAYSPNNTLTRQEIATFIMRAFFL